MARVDEKDITQKKNSPVHPETKLTEVHIGSV